MKKMHLITIGYRTFAYESVSAATAALAALAKGVPVKYESGGNYVQDDDTVRSEMELKLNRPVSLYQKPKRLGLPAPKRNSVECPFCESVSVVRGTNCQSCGEYVS
jgi:hypothetical protein